MAFLRIYRPFRFTELKIQIRFPSTLYDLQRNRPLFQYNPVLIRLNARSTNSPFNANLETCRFLDTHSVARPLDLAQREETEVHYYKAEQSIAALALPAESLVSVISYDSNSLTL